MDLNPDLRRLAASVVQTLLQASTEPWPLPDESLDTVFTSNFLEHLPHREAVRKVFGQALRCLKPGGRFIAMGPNIKYVPGAYWYFFEHFVELTERPMAEGLSNGGYEIEAC